jgi:hypothetical protein
VVSNGWAVAYRKYSMDYVRDEADAIADYKEIHGDVDLEGARFVRLGFI